MTRTATKPPTSIHGGECELKRYSPEQVVKMQLLPYTSVRTVKEKCYRRELFHHTDGGRITFTAEDIRRNSELGAVAPLAISRAA
ncbi:hypothetical protein [Streptomyces sp. NPDC007063]|uniref:hypothetical protein n=1 Tax=Streptomyces sp. NPDC007063 TaxID=3364772 RepID=UPI0036CBBA0D